MEKKVTKKELISNSIIFPQEHKTKFWLCQQRWDFGFHFPNKKRKEKKEEKASGKLCCKKTNDPPPQRYMIKCIMRSLSFQNVPPSSRYSLCMLCIPYITTNKLCFPQHSMCTHSPVHPLRFSLLTSAPCCSRTLAQSRWPSVTARWRGVRPRGSRDSKSVWMQK